MSEPPPFRTSKEMTTEALIELLRKWGDHYGGLVREDLYDAADRLEWLAGKEKKA